jgi:hypothetical protein
MSKISVVVAVLLISFLSWGKENFISGQVIRSGNDFLIRAKDKNGLTREYAVTNPKDFDYDFLRLEGQTVNLKGTFQDKDLRTGTVKLIEVTEGDFNPLGT